MLTTRDLELARLADALGTALRAQRARLVTAESCTGGWVAKVCTDLPGSSDWFECGFVTYSNAAKMRDLGVSEDTLRTHGAVSRETVAAMARGALSRGAAESSRQATGAAAGGAQASSAQASGRVQLAVAISGVAGPDGGTTDKPVGTVWFGLARQVNGGIEVKTELQRFDGDRDDVRRASTFRALELALAFIQ